MCCGAAKGGNKVLLENGHVVPDKVDSAQYIVA